MEHHLVDGIVPEPLGGAHNNPVEIFETVKAEIFKQLNELNLLDAEERITKRIEKYCAMGHVVEATEELA